MNFTVIEILGMVIATGIGLLLLAVGSIMFLKDNNKKATNEITEDAKERIEFLKRYAIQIESMRKYEDFEDYESEIEWINRNIDELEKGNSEKEDRE